MFYEQEKGLFLGLFLVFVKVYFCGFDKMHKNLPVDVDLDRRETKPPEKP